MRRFLRRTQATFLLMLLFGAPVLHAQAPIGPVPVRVGLTAATSELRTANSATAELRRAVAADSLRESHWLKGGVIGAVVGGLLGYAATAGADKSFGGVSSDRHVVNTLGMTALGFGIGALIGGQFKK